MKYLKVYKLFESTEEIETEIREVLADLTDDDDFILTIDIVPPGTPISKQLASDRENIDILIFKDDSQVGKMEQFAYLDIKDSILRLVEHLSDRYNIVFIKVLVGHNKFDVYPRYELSPPVPISGWEKPIFRNIDLKFEKK